MLSWSWREVEVEKVISFHLYHDNHLPTTSASTTTSTTIALRLLPRHCTLSTPRYTQLQSISTVLCYSVSLSRCCTYLRRVTSRLSSPLHLERPDHLHGYNDCNDYNDYTPIATWYRQNPRPVQPAMALNPLLLELLKTTSSLGKSLFLPRGKRYTAC